jgi:Fe-S-cluster-containing dehydrogenase component
MSEHGTTPSAVRYGMAIDLDKCTGCMACSVACQQENNVSYLVDESNKLRSITWMKIFSLENGKDYPEYQHTALPRPCQHCDAAHDAPCTFVCPVNATKRDEQTGIVSQIYPRCIGCRYCIAACPYHARYFNWWDPTWPKSMEAMLSPEVSVRTRLTRKVTSPGSPKILGLSACWPNCVPNPRCTISVNTNGSISWLTRGCDAHRQRAHGNGNPRFALSSRVQKERVHTWTKH